MDCCDPSEFYQFSKEQPEAIPDDIKKIYTIDCLKSTLNQYCHVDLIIQAAFCDIFDINFDLHSYVAELFGPNDINQHIANAIYYKMPGLM